MENNENNINNPSTVETAEDRNGKRNRKLGLGLGLGLGIPLIALGVAGVVLLARDNNGSKPVTTDTLSLDVSKVNNLFQPNKPAQEFEISALSTTSNDVTIVKTEAKSDNELIVVASGTNSNKISIKTLAVGSANVTITAYDSANNKGSVKIPLTVSGLIPEPDTLVLNTTMLPSAIMVEQQDEYDLNAFYNNKKVTLESVNITPDKVGIANVTWNKQNETIKYEGLAEGEVELTINATDTDGHTTQVKVSLTVKPEQSITKNGLIFNGAVYDMPDECNPATLCWKNIDGGYGWFDAYMEIPLKQQTNDDPAVLKIKFTDAYKITKVQIVKTVDEFEFDWDNDMYFLTMCGGLKNANLSGLTNVALIPWFFMSGCSNLKELDMSNCQASYIDDYFLAYATNLKSIKLPTIKYIAPKSNLQVKAAANPYVGNCFLTGCTSLTSIDLTPITKSGGNNERKIGSWFLSECTNLETVIFNSSDSDIFQIESIGQDFLSNCPKLTTFTINQYLILCGGDILVVDDNFMRNCTGLQSLDLSKMLFQQHGDDTVTSVGENFLDGCTSLSTIELFNFASPEENSASSPPLLSFSKNFMSNCTSLTKIDFSKLSNPDNCITDLSFADYCLYNCTNLKEINFAYLEPTCFKKGDNSEDHSFVKVFDESQTSKDTYTYNVTYYDNYYDGSKTQFPDIDNTPETIGTDTVYLGRIFDTTALYVDNMSYSSTSSTLEHYWSTYYWINKTNGFAVNDNIEFSYYKNITGTGSPVTTESSAWEITEVFDYISQQTVDKDTYTQTIDWDSTTPGKLVIKKAISKSTSAADRFDWVIKITFTAPDTGVKYHFDLNLINYGGE